MRRHLCLLCLLTVLVPSSARAAWDAVPPVDWSKIKLSDFRDDELDLPFFLDHFHELANGIVETGPQRGYITAHVWRGLGQQHPYNARVMETYLTVAYFYCTDRPWNVYHGSPLVRERLEAMLEYWLTLRNKDGVFSEYGYDQYNLPATAFATKFMGQTLTLLKDGPPIDPDLLKRVTEADRKAIIAVLTLPDLYKHGRSYTNQYSNVFAGAPAYLALHPDPEINHLLEKVYRTAVDDFQSPAGFFYERDGADFGYTLHTTNSDMTMAYFYLRNTPLGELIEKQEARWADWLSYNLLREPDGSTFVINRCIESRQRHAEWQRQESPMAERVDLARAFATTTEERAEQVKQEREILARDWGHFPPMAGGTMTPYSFVHRTHYTWSPTDAQRDAAVAKLPYLVRESFNHQRADDRFPLVCTYVRRPSYYAIFDAGTHRNDQQRYGLGLLWNPRAGAVLQSQTDLDTATWGTRLGEDAAPVEAGDLAPTYSIDGKPVTAEPGHRDLSIGALTVRYPLESSTDGGEKTIVFKDGDATVSVHHAGQLTEQLPLLAPAGKVQITAGKATVAYPGVDLTIEFDPSVKADVRTSPTTRSMRNSLTIGDKQLVVLQLSGRDALQYRIRFIDHGNDPLIATKAPLGHPYPDEVGD
jgi:hypothetical protein